MDFFQTQNLRVATFIFVGVVSISFIIISIVLNFHWKNYGINIKDVSKLRRTYFSVAFVILAIIATAFFLII